MKVEYALDHHARTLKPLVQMLRSALDGSGVMHAMRHWSTGANSNYIQLAGRRVYLRGIVWPTPKIEVLDKCRGRVVLELRNERDIIRFVATL
jgi:hypothetical protein